MVIGLYLKWQTLSLKLKQRRGIAAQILRHRSFSFQEFSQRYADASFLREYDRYIPELRTQDHKEQTK